MDITFSDKEFGNIILRENGRLKRVGISITASQIILKKPTFYPKSEAFTFFNDHRDWVREKIQLRKAKTKRILLAPDVPFFCTAFSIKYQPHEKNNFKAQLLRSQKELLIFYPTQTDFNDDATQKTLGKIVSNALLIEAKQILPPWLKQVAEAHGFQYAECKVSRMRSQWGSCSSRKSIHLSSSLLLLPTELAEAIMLHELCHTIEMNHGPRFHALMAKHTQNREAELTRQLHNYAHILHI